MERYANVLTHNLAYFATVFKPNILSASQLVFTAVVIRLPAVKK
jgi:hypothetical protein